MSQKQLTINDVKEIVSRIEADCMGIEFEFIVEYDKVFVSEEWVAWKKKMLAARRLSRSLEKEIAKYDRLFISEEWIEREKQLLLSYNLEKEPPKGRVYIQCKYIAPCTKTGLVQEWKGAKWYLSSFMTQQEVIGRAYLAFETAIKHEIMEGFKVDKTILFNPHVDFGLLLNISKNSSEITRS